MSPIPSYPGGMYFEEFEVGQKILTAGRTVTEADIVAFAGLSGDFNQIHTDREYSKATSFGQRVAHGLLGVSIATGLAVQAGVLRGTVLAFREIKEWKFILPVYIGDTLQVEMDVLETKALRRIGGGAVIIGMDVKNQEGKSTMKGNLSVLIMSKPE